MTALAEQRLEFPTEPEYVPVRARFLCSGTRKDRVTLCNALLFVGWVKPTGASIELKCPKCDKITVFE